MDHISWNPVLDNQNNANLGAVIEDNENENVFLVNIIQLKGVGRKYESRDKPLCHVQT